MSSNPIKTYVRGTPEQVAARALALALQGDLGRDRQVPLTPPSYVSVLRWPVATLSQETAQLDRAEVMANSGKSTDEDMNTADYSVCGAVAKRPPSQELRTRNSSGPPSKTPTTQRRRKGRQRNTISRECKCYATYTSECLNNPNGDIERCVHDRAPQCTNGNGHADSARISGAYCLFIVTTNLNTICLIIFEYWQHGSQNEQGKLYLFRVGDIEHPRVSLFQHRRCVTLPTPGYKGYVVTQVMSTAPPERILAFRLTGRADECEYLVKFQGVSATAARWLGGSDVGESAMDLIEQYRKRVGLSARVTTPFMQHLDGPSGSSDDERRRKGQT